MEFYIIYQNSFHKTHPRISAPFFSFYLAQYFFFLFSYFSFCFGVLFSFKYSNNIKFFLSWSSIWFNGTQTVWSDGVNVYWRCSWLLFQIFCYSEPVKGNVSFVFHWCFIVVSWMFHWCFIDRKWGYFTSYCQNSSKKEFKQKLSISPSSSLFKFNTHVLYQFEKYINNSVIYQKWK